MWKSYYKLCASETYREFTLQKIGVKICPIFYQCITDILIKQMVMIKFPIAAESEPAAQLGRSLCSALYCRFSGSFSEPLSRHQPEFETGAQDQKS